jgi:DNA repair exonuclease SbcCD ATPase subunit
MRAKEDTMDAQNKLDAQRQIQEIRRKSRAKLEEAWVQASSVVADKMNEVKELEKQVNAEKDFCALLGKEGFLGVIFEEVLSEVAHEANDILRQLANTSHVSVAFRTENAKGKRAINAVFNVDGYEATRQSGLSGGMGASADLAIDLGICSVIEKRLGRFPGWLMLDETFNGMPKNVKEAAFEILEKFSRDRLVIVVDHSTEMKASFRQVLTVTNENGTSRV